MKGGGGGRSKLNVFGMLFGAKKFGNVPLPTLI